MLFITLGHNQNTLQKGQQHFQKKKENMTIENRNRSELLRADSYIK